MPPKVRITKEEIVRVGVELVRKDGPAALNARSVAAALNCSTQPVFSNFATMEELQKAVDAAAYEYYLVFLQREAERGEYPTYKAFGMAYIRFAKEESELFKFLFMCDRKGEERKPTVDFEASVEMIMKSNGIGRDQAEMMHLEMWACVHGIAAMLVTSFLTLQWDLISKMLSDVYHGVRMIYAPEEGRG